MIYFLQQIYLLIGILWIPDKLSDRIIHILHDLSIWTGGYSVLAKK
jgi:hypothetical protein